MKRLGLIKEKIGGKREKTAYVLDKEHARKQVGEVGKLFRGYI